MINEYALEPSLLSNWKDFRYFVEQFGIPNGRLISRYPKIWKRLVYESLSECGDREKKRIEEALTRIDDKLLPRNNKWDNQKNWLANAEEEHERQPFHAIIARGNPRKNTDVLEADDINESTLLWHNPTEIIIKRKANDMAQAVASLLRISKVIMLIDPHFGPEVARYRRSLHEFLVATINNRTIPALKTIEIHTSAKAKRDYFRRECLKRLPSIIPDGIEVRVIRWNELQGGEQFHNRFILTDLGGVAFRTGLDEGGEGETDEVSILPYDVYIRRYEQFKPDSHSYEFSDDVVIKG